ncbi:hypothetical protein BJ170DRAFT_13574 [Xylariales sp. AK1849]|nr:hypothetical protein BJ170DRAFT_13574 [Xylariales sp. AK1849]
MGLDGFSTINFGEPEPLANRPSVILGVIIPFMIAKVSSWICVLGRLYTRIKILRKPGWDDLFVGAYAICTTTGSVSCCLSIKYGLGQHFLLLRPDQMENFMATFYVMNAAYNTATTFIKLALLFQYLRVYGRGHIMYKVTLFMIIFVGLWGFSYSFIAWVPCVPVRSFWEAPPDARCWGYGSSIPSQFTATFESHTTFNMILDLIILTIPLPLLFKEGTAFKQRLRILALLFIGSIVIMLAIWRLATIIQHQTGTWPTRDPTWYAPISLILGVLEVDFAAICASIPIFWPVLEQQWGSIFITQEIKVTHEDRYDDHFSTANHHNRTGSETELKRVESNRTVGGLGGAGAGAGAHYDDMFVMRSVDPLMDSAGDSMPSVQVGVRSDNTKNKGRKWHL